MANSSIICLAGGYDQMALIRGLQQYGFEVIVLDWSEQPLASTIAEHIRISTLDVDAVENYVNRINPKYIVTTSTDQALLTASIISEKKHIPFYLSPRTALSVTNKKFMKEVLVRNNILTSKYIIVDNNIESYQLNMLLDNFHCEYLVVKPCDCNSSKGIKRISKNADAHNLIRYAIEQSRTKTAIIEEYVYGIELSIDLWIDNNYKPSILSITETGKNRQTPNNFLIWRSVSATNLSDGVIKNIEKIAEKIVSAFGLKLCPMLLQVLLSGDDIYVIEFSPRIGGGTKYKLIEHTSGIDIMNVYIKMLLGFNISAIQPKRSKYIYELDYIYTSGGRLKRIEGLDELQKNKIIKEYYEYKKTGDIIQPASNSGDRAAGVLLEGDTKSAIENKKKVFLEKVKILDENEHDIMLRAIFKG